MAPARRARSPNGAHVSYADESEPDTEPDTPKPQKSHLRKRLSEAFIPENDGSFTSDANGVRVPLKSVNINDDEAEKRRRRKSTKITVIENAVAGPSSEGNQDASADTSRAAGKGKQQLNSVAPPSTIKVSLDVMSSNFEEWMKMATDNKINAANSWNFALIDYFHDMSLLRNNDDNSINFQRASCTLDGCVKIWTSRVDSVGTETNKLLSNLASGGGDDEDGNNSDNPDGDATQAKKKKAHRPGANLAKDPAVLQNKKLDLEFSVDPLFKKTCADFDEGGAHGLLMNHLSLGLGSDGGMRVIFDAGDSVFKEEDEVPDEPQHPVDLSELRAKFLPDLTALDSKAISHSLAGFSFAKDFNSLGDSTYLDTTRFDDGEDADDGSGDAGGGFQMDVDPAPVEDFFAGAEAINDDFAYGGGGDMGGDMGGDDFGGDAHSNGSVGPAGGGEEGRPGPFVPFDPRKMPNERDLVLAMAVDEGDDAMDYFNLNFHKNWAGPEHWKLKKVIRRIDTEATAGNKGTKTRTKKEAVKIDFLSPPEKELKEIRDELFAPVTGKGASINLPGTGVSGKRGSRKKKEKKDDHRLPDDMHFSSRQLVTLFLKPKFYLKMRGRRARMNDGDGEIDENFWAQAAADQAGGQRGDEDGDDTNGENIPFNTQFFHEDFDDGPGFDDAFDGDGPGPSVDAGEQDLLAATQGQTRRVKPEFVNYAKRAKRVDVRRLKDNIWKGLDIVISKMKIDEDGDEETMEVDEPSGPPPTDPSESRQFSQVITGLQKSYPQDKLQEISTSFCFICLLHLANEQGLKLESAVDNAPIDTIIPDDEEDIIAAGEKKIGDIWDIKIFRDRNATQSA